MSSRSKPSTRAQRFWDRLTSWYGSRFTDQHGTKLDPLSDWCELVDAHDNDVVALALSEIKTKHSQFPPSFPEVDAIFARLKAPAQSNDKPANHEALSDFVLRHRTLTPNQLRMPWTYIGRMFDAPGLDGKIRHNHGVEITGVVIPADGEHPGYRVMVTDMQAEDMR
jgi:hypothetical protein